MGITDAPSTDYRGKPVNALDPLRDLPNLLGWWDFSTLTGTDGTAVRRVTDKSGLGQDLVQSTSANQPTKQTDSADGKPVLRVASGQFMQATSLAASWPIGSTVGPPVTIVAVVKPSASQVDTFACVAGGITAGGQTRTIIQQSTGTAFASATGVSSSTTGQPVMDGAWHVLITASDVSAASQFVDGWLTGTSNAAATADGIKGFTLGAVNSTTNRYVGDVREVMVFAGRLRFDQVQKLTTVLAARANGITVGTPQASVGREDTVSSNGQSIGVWEPTNPSTPKTVILWSHPASQNQLLSPAYWGYPLVHAAMAQGWYFAASNMHGDSWGNTSAQADLLDLYNFVNGRYAPTNVLLVGASMGGLPTALAVAAASIPNMKGAYLIDAALNLKAMYANSLYTASIATAYGLNSGTLSAASLAAATSISSSVSFPSGTSILIDPQGANPETVTTTGAPTGAGPFTIPVPALGFAHASGAIVSDYPGKTAGFDPNLKPASSYATRLRFTASTTDTNVVESTNTDAFRSLVAATATESALVPHLSTHLTGAAANPPDFVAFVKRCIS